MDGGGDDVAAGGPFAEVEDATAVGAEGEVGRGGEDYFAAGGAEEGFGCGHEVGSQGLRSWSSWMLAKSFVLRVTRVRLCSRAVAARKRSGWE
jgi:hypothetical protein